MRAITNGQVEGFPSPEEVRTFYVKHDINGSEDRPLKLRSSRPSQLLASTMSTRKPLSGGWEMKLALARAMLFKADILLFDELTINDY